MYSYTLLVVAVLYLAAGRTDATNSTYNPALTWDLCSPSRIRVTLSGAVEGGIIYIKGYGAACKQETYATETQHEFDFDACGIDAETYFTIIVQKNPLYQTGSDLQQSLLCIYDLSDITVSNDGLNVGDKGDDAGINKTVKPSATMKLYSDGQEVGGGSVKLTDMITMSLMLDDEFLVDFDIKAKYCTANYLDIIVDYCAEDGSLFPDFVAPAQGALTSTFGAFRTTDLGGGYVEMTFSCTVEVCRGLCSPTVCANGNEGRGRRRRDVNDEIDTVNVGASFSVGTDVDIASSDLQPEDSLCINNSVFIIIVVVITVALATSMSVTSYVTHRLMKGTDAVGKLAMKSLENCANVVDSSIVKEKVPDKNTEDTKVSEDTKVNSERRLSKVNIMQTNSDTAQTTVRQSSINTIKVPQETVEKESGDALNNRPARPTITKQGSVTVMYNTSQMNCSANILQRNIGNINSYSLSTPGTSQLMNATNGGHQTGGMNIPNVAAGYNGTIQQSLQNGYSPATNMQTIERQMSNINTIHQQHSMPTIGFQSFQ